MLFRFGLVLFSLAISRLAAATPTDADDESAEDASFAKHGVVGGAHFGPAPPSRRTSGTGDRLALLAHVGIGAPGGALGVDLDVAPIPYVALNASLGLSPGGPQYALMLRARAPIGSLAAGRHTFLTLGAGPSVGRYENQNANAGLSCLFTCALEQNGETKARQTFERAVWYNIEIGLDVYSREGRGLLRTSLGYGWISNARDYTCPPASGGYPPGGGCDRKTGKSLAFFMFAYGFDL